MQTGQVALMTENQPMSIAFFLLLIFSHGAQRNNQLFHHQVSGPNTKLLPMLPLSFLWLQSLFRECGIFEPTALILYCDNIGATYLSSNLVFYARTKHIKIDYHFIRDRVAAKSLTVKFLSNKDQIADVLTKPLASISLKKIM